MHESTAREFREKFKLLSDRWVGISKIVLERNFMKGLKPETRTTLHPFKSRGLNEAMELVQLIEDQNATMKFGSTLVGKSKDYIIESQQEEPKNAPVGTRTRVKKTHGD